ncbi:MAG: glycosyltransferase family 2 protein [Pseudomonadota bacterium]
MTGDLRDARYAADEPVKVSIATVAYNHEGCLRQCLDSLLDQVCAFRVEIIVHDDASTDATADVIGEYEAAYPDIVRGIFQNENQFSKGVNPQYNYVFPKARGEYIAVCDGDDYWCDPLKLARQVEALDENPDVAVTYGRVKADTEEGIVEPYRNGLERDVTALELKKGMPINTSTACYRNIFPAPPPFLKYAPMGDMTVWAALGHHGRGMFLPQIAPSGYRIHSAGMFSTKPQSAKRFAGAMTLLAMAAYHNDQGDKAGMRACIKRLLGLLVELNGVGPSLGEAMRKSISVGLKRLRFK